MHIKIKVFAFLVMSSFCGLVTEAAQRKSRPSPAGILPLEYRDVNRELTKQEVKGEPVQVVQPETLATEATPELMLNRESQMLNAERKKFQRKPIGALTPDDQVTSLEEALAATYYWNVELETSRTQIKKLVEENNQRLAEWRPQVAVEASQRLDKSHSTTIVSAPGLPRAVNDFRVMDRQRTSNGNLQVTAKQNLYNGGGTMARTAKADQAFRAGLFQLASKEQETFMRTITAYIEVIVAEEILTMEKKSEHYLREFYNQARLRRRVGDQTPAEEATAKAKLSDAEVRVSAALANVQAKRAQLAQLTGLRVGKTLIMPNYYRNIPRTLADLRKSASTYYPPLVAAVFNLRAAQYEVANAMSRFLPTADVQAGIGPSSSSYLNQVSPAYLRNKRHGTARNANILVTVSMPLYNGSTNSLYRAAGLQLKEARLDLENQRRTVADLCATYFANFRAAQQNVAASKASLDANRVALEAARTEYALGLKKFLDVLQIEEYWLQSYRQYIHAMAELIKNSYQVLQLTGKLTAKTLGLNVRSYDPCEYYKRYVDSWYSFGDNQEKAPLFELPKSSGASGR